MTPPESVRRNAKPFLHGPEFTAVCEALEVGQYGHTAATETFEARLAAFLGVDDVVAVSSCTAALHLALVLAGAGPGTEVIVPAQTFCATVHAILMAGADPHFVDINADTLCIDPAAARAAITPRTRAVLPVLYGGRAVDLTSIQPILDDHDIAIVEDAAHAFGSRHGNKQVGATGALTCFSFGPIKNLTCGEGGALIPRNTREAHTARTLRLLGVTTSQATRIRSTTYQVDRPGWRYHLSALHAVIGTVQLERFGIVETLRRSLWRIYARELGTLDDVTIVDVDIDNTVPFNLVVRIPQRDTVFDLMRDRGIGVGVHYPPNHTQPAFARWYRPLPVTDETAAQIMTLPFHPAMTERDVRYVASALRQALARIHGA
ncbi:DegT/DnrJ/EryC1/StrS family aminotransferase [Nocardia terpenica]|uniref:DegT/DnrJ/EryC1/StrS family aminotransferase n=1 Tax=Nocardia terpenica TaxID=455432 RepID=UPI001892E173|nr:DegT/DnrJ/EryC1/StrS family aminotransferase [Nocardia terpenica]MBF6059257.1 DegT/DnrJ/EryC1/StrS family aminotransferase [Nocardia terpenica]MBF6103204.1 DegT/DnrJ/EryC1/StrS family aminotransferase [Nocardia terpenica]MBF6110607.1 DegT/DnrJ/EryC1/StrS family aminotransferase [Nocardia terpenica]MBF6116738.1 DegT/DnrJ/EryC1/StrS family aminotransferase [Nocardia terpenica]